MKVYLQRSRDLYNKKSGRKVEFYRTSLMEEGLNKKDNWNTNDFPRENEDFIETSVIPQENNK